MTAPELATTAFTLRLLGPFAACVNGTPLPPLRTRKDAWLLGLLVLHHPRPLDRAWMAGLLWPDSADVMARSNLRVSLKFLRRALGPEAERLLHPTPSSLALDLAKAEVDLLAFDAAIARGDPASLARAVALYRGPLLDGWLEPWVLPERQAREEAYLQALEALAARATAARQPGSGGALPAPGAGRRAAAGRGAPGVNAASRRRWQPGGRASRLSRATPPPPPRGAC